MQAVAKTLTEDAPMRMDRHRDSFTMTSNHLLDEVIPGVGNAVAGLILVQVERMTTGFHREVASVSVAAMMDFTGASRSTVNRARRELIQAGYLVVVSEGTGHRAAKYRLELRPGEDVSPDAHGYAHTTHPSPASSQDTQNIPSVVPEAGDVWETRTSAEPSPEDMPEPQPAADDIPCGTQLHRSVSVSEYSGTDMTPQGVHGEHPSNGLNIEKEKTNREAKTAFELDPAQGPEAAMGAVCSSLRSSGFSVERDDYAFIRWCCREYGKEKILHKLEILRLQLLRGVRFTNPLGWLRSALAGDYQYSMTDTARVKAEELAEQERERSQRESEELQKHRDQVRRERDDPEAQARVKACQDRLMERFRGQDE